MGGLRSAHRGRRYVTVSLVTAALLAVPAHAGQMGASKNPRASGPIELSGRSCANDKAVHEGETIALLNSCIWLYEFNKAMETDLARSYGAGWVQTTVDPVNGWCATKVASELSVPGTVTLHNSAPQRRVTTKKKTRTRVKLNLDAEGNAVDEANISQRFNLYPRKMWTAIPDSNRAVQTTWRGRESSKLAFALGAEISWGMLETPNIKGGLGRMSFVKSRDC